MRNLLKGVNSLSPKQIDYIAKPTVANNVQLVQSVSKLPVPTINAGSDSNKTLQLMSAMWAGKRYKRETNLKFSEGSVESYESFRSQWNIHHRMLGCDDNRTGVELYMSLKSKAVLKVEKVVENTDGTWGVTKMWDALDHAFLQNNHHESQYRQFPPDA